MYGGRKSRKPKKPYDYARSWNYALWLLSQRMYTSKQIRDKLLGKEVDADIIERVMQKLADLKFTDDESYANAYVRSRKTQKGPIALRQELFRKGVSEELVVKTLDAFDPEAQLASATELLVKNRWRLNKDDARKNYAKAYAFLARRGFGSDIVKQAIATSGVLDETDAFEAED